MQPDAEPGTGRAKGSPRPWHGVQTHAMGCGDPVGENRRRCKSPLTQAEPAGQECSPRAHPAMGVRRGRERGGRPRAGAPPGVEAWTTGARARRSCGERRRFPGAGRPPSWTRAGTGRGHPRGRRAGPVALGGARARGRAPGLLALGPAGDPGRPKVLAGRGGCPHGTSPAGTPRRDGRRPGSGKRAPRDATRDGPGGSLRGASSRRRWGTQAHRTPGRAGDAGQHVARDRPPGETLRAPTGTPPRPRLAAPAARAAARVCPPLAPRIAEDVLREASRHPSPSSAPGMDGGTAETSAAHRDEHRRDRPARLRRGRAQAAPGERGGSAKADGSQRPIGTPACEEQSVQRAGARRLEARSAQDVLDGS
jgi:hypothetical protein